MNSLLLAIPGGASIALIALVLGIFIIPMWFLYEKANYPGWTSLIPIYNIYILIKIARKPAYWLFFLCIPYINIIFIIWLWNSIAKAFGKTEAFTVGIIFLGIIFIPILAFGSSKYDINKLN